MTRTIRNKSIFVTVISHKVAKFERLFQFSPQQTEAPKGIVNRSRVRFSWMTAGSMHLKGDYSTERRADFTKSTFCIVVIYLACVVAAKAQSHKLIRGTVTAIRNGVLTVNSDAGGAVQVQPDPAAQIQKLAPGSTDVKTAVAATFEGISVGDRILASASVPDSGPAVARIIYLMKRSDIIRNNAAEQADWQKRGISGLVRSMNPAAHTVTISVVSAVGTQNITIQVTSKTQLMRYAADSVKFADAIPGPFALIQVGDQLTTRGDKSPDGLMTADEIVTGSFRNISGQIVKIDLPGDALTIKDLATKTTVTVALTSNTDMHMLPQAVATKFAARLKSGGAGPATGRDSGQSDGDRSASSDLTQMIGRMPLVTLAQLKPGDALMIAATASIKVNSVTAISLLSGVEPILAAPEASSMTLAPWSLSSGNPN